jgi:hypothetical protein
MSADQYKQIGILRGATSLNMKSTFIRQNEKITGVKGPIRKIKKPIAVLS